MKKGILTSMLLIGLMFGFSTAVMAEAKIAVIDIQAVVAKSAQVQALKKENTAKVQELQKWLKTCKADIEKQKTQEGKEKLAKKYEAELQKKQEANGKAYAEKLKAIDKSITDTIVNEAKAKGYDLVITKQGSVIYGGTDITESIKSIVK